MTEVRRIGLVVEVAYTSMIHAAASYFLRPFAVRYAAHQLNLWPCVSVPETSPTLRWTGEVGDVSVFWVWGSRAFVRDTSADKLSARAIPCVFLGFPPDVPCLQFYQPTSRRVIPSQDVTFDESVPFYRLFPYRSAPPPPPPLFLAPDPLPGTVPVEVAVGSGAARGASSGGAASGSVEPGGAESEGAGSGGAEPGGVEPWDAEPGGVEPTGAEPGGAEPEGVEPGGAECEGAESGEAEPLGTASSGDRAGASPRLSPRPEPLSPQQLREWLAQRTRLLSGAAGAGDSAARDTRAGGAGVTTGAGGTEGAVAAGLGGAHTKGTRVAGTGGFGGAGAGDPTEPGAARAGGAGGTGAGGSGAGGAGAVDPGDGGAGGTSQPPLQPASPLRAPSPYTEQTGNLTERREPASRPASPIRTAVSFLICVPLQTPAHTLWHFVLPLFHCVFLCDLLLSPLFLPSLASTAASALVAELVDFAAACLLDYATALVAESEFASPPSVGDECALGMDVLEDRQEDFECLAGAAIMGPYSSQWQAAMDAEMASSKSTGIYVDAVPPSWVNIVDGMWIFMVKQPPGSPPAFKARYVAAQCDYELHSLDFSAAFLQDSTHEEIWLRRPPGFTRSFPTGTQWSLRWSVYGLRQAPREWHDTLRTTLAALGFTPSTVDPSLFLRADTSLPLFYVLVYVNDLVFATADIEALTWPTPLPIGQSLSAPPSDESVEPSGPYPELVGCLMYLMTCTRPDLVYPLSLLATWLPYVGHGARAWRTGSSCPRWLTYLLTDLGEQPRLPPVMYFDTSLDNLQLYLLSNSKDSVSLFDLASGAASAPPATADSATRSQWLTRDAAARLAIRNNLPLAERAHFGQHRTAQASYDTVVTRYSSPAIAALGRLLLPYLFPKLSDFATVEDLVTHLRTSDARYRATVPSEFLDRNLSNLYLAMCDSKEGLSLFDLTSGASTAPTADADSTVCSQWLTRDAAARLAVRNHLPSTERLHFSQYKSARALYDAVVARYSSPTTAALSRLMLPYLFPDLAAISKVVDLVTHLRTSDTRYRATLPTEFLPTNSPPHVHHPLLPSHPPLSSHGSLSLPLPYRADCRLARGAPCCR
ncbi:unnamed protein product [Closterium sp. NIES-53]